MATMSIVNPTQDGEVSTPNPSIQPNPLNAGISSLADQLSKALVAKQLFGNGPPGSGAKTGDTPANNSTTGSDPSVNGDTTASGSQQTPAQGQAIASQAMVANEPNLSDSIPVQGVNAPQFGPNMPSSATGAYAPSPLASVGPNANPAPGSSDGPFTEASSEAIPSAASANKPSADDQDVSASVPSPKNGQFPIPGTTSSAGFTPAPPADASNPAAPNAIDDFLSRYAKSRNVDPAFVKQAMASQNGSTSGTASQGGITTPVSPTSSNMTDRGLAAMNYLVTQKGWTPASAAIIVGNGQQESGVQSNGGAGDPNTPGGSHGMFQWNNGPNNSPGGRLDQLKAYAASTGRAWTDPTAQLDFMDREVSARNPAWKTQQDLSNAAPIGHGYEGYGDDSQNTRVMNAQNFLHSWSANGGKGVNMDSLNTNGGNGAGISNQFSGAGTYKDYNMTPAVQAADANLAHYNAIMSNPNISAGAKAEYATGVYDKGFADAYAPVQSSRQAGNAAVNDQNNNNISATNAVTAQGELAEKQREFNNPEQTIVVNPDGSRVAVNTRTLAQTPLNGPQALKPDMTVINDGNGQPAWVYDKNNAKLPPIPFSQWTGAGSANSPVKAWTPPDATAPASGTAQPPAGTQAPTGDAALKAAMMAVGGAGSPAASGAHVGLPTPPTMQAQMAPSAGVLNYPPSELGALPPAASEGLTFNTAPAGNAGDIDTSALTGGAAPKFAGHIDGSGNIIGSASAAPLTFKTAPPLDLAAAPAPAPAPAPASAEPTPTNPAGPIADAGKGKPSDEFIPQDKSLSDAEKATIAGNIQKYAATGQYSQQQLDQAYEWAQQLSSGKTTITQLRAGTSGNKAFGLAKDIAEATAIPGGQDKASARGDLFTKSADTASPNAIGAQNAGFNNMVTQAGNFMRTLDSIDKDQGKFAVANAVNGRAATLQDPTGYLAQRRTAIAEQGDFLYKEIERQMKGGALGEGSMGNDLKAANNEILEDLPTFAANLGLKAGTAMYNKAIHDGNPLLLLKDPDQPTAVLKAIARTAIESIKDRAMATQEQYNLRGTGMTVLQPNNKENWNYVMSNGDLPTVDDQKAKAVSDAAANSMPYSSITNW